MDNRHPKYWLYLFTGPTWKAFRDVNAKTCGFTRRWRKIAESIAVGDFFICYLTGVTRWVGVLKVKRALYEGGGPEWTRRDFPLLFDVEPITLLNPEHGVPLATFEGKVDFFQRPEDRKGYKQFFRRFPNEFKRKEDAVLVVSHLEEAHKNPIFRPVSETLLNKGPRFRRPRGRA